MKAYRAYALEFATESCKWKTKSEHALTHQLQWDKAKMEGFTV